MVAVAGHLGGRLAVVGKAVYRIYLSLSAAYVGGGVLQKRGSASFLVTG